MKANIKLQLAEEETAAALEGDVSVHGITPASMLIELLEIEDQQCVPF